jgi:hypothetical protein
MGLTGFHFLRSLFFLPRLRCDGEIAIFRRDVEVAAGRRSDSGRRTWLWARRLPPSLSSEGYWWREGGWMWAAHRKPPLLLKIVDGDRCGRIAGIVWRIRGSAEGIHDAGHRDAEREWERHGYRKYTVVAVVK